MGCENVSFTANCKKILRFKVMQGDIIPGTLQLYAGTCLEALGEEKTGSL